MVDRFKHLKDVEKGRKESAGFCLKGCQSSYQVWSHSVLVGAAAPPPPPAARARAARAARCSHSSPAAALLIAAGFGAPGEVRSSWLSIRMP